MTAGYSRYIKVLAVVMTPLSAVYLSFLILFFYFFFFIYLLVKR